jgi:four helix bundle protein
MHDFRKLTVWQKAHELTIGVYQVTAGFPVRERFGLVDQLRRACVSIETNVSEGAGRRSNADFARYLDIAFGSANETDDLLQVSKDCGFLEAGRWRSLAALVTEIRKMLWALTLRVRSGARSLPPL